MTFSVLRSRVVTGLAMFCAAGWIVGCDSTSAPSPAPMSNAARSPSSEAVPDCAGGPCAASSASASSQTSERAAESCVGSGNLCLGLKYVSYRDYAGNAYTSEASALANVRGINQIFAQCRIAFQIEDYAAIDARDYGLQDGPAAQSQTYQIRGALAETSRLLIVQTGRWGSNKNAWTSMPGGAPYGAILEGSIADYPVIIAHELGHYLNLDHVNDSSNLLNVISYATATRLTAGQCATMRAAAQGIWSPMLR